MNADEQPTFYPLVKYCAAHGICRSVAFDLAATGILDTFLIGNRRYVMLDSVKALPQTVRQRQLAARYGA
jgi:hypothetical protein